MCGIARLLHVACEWADQQPTIDAGPVHAVLAHARLGLQQRTERVRTLMAMRLSQR
jgi:hypothetical protein